ncbi:hypothetical protein ACFZAR_41985 [Streptomyces sp. NPDC008222]|uniref:hypothetical protein n=1 Tax=Streptomyces sp. NPDC008222 TaxID=3364820 RepID=UPI0036E2396C
MTDGITWLAEPKSSDWGGYSVVIALYLAGEELAARVAAGRFGRNKQLPRFLGSLTGWQADDAMSGLFGDTHQAIALRYGEIDEWSYVVQHGFWYGEFGHEPPVSRGGAHVYRLWYEEENGKPVPPYFSYEHDSRTIPCSSQGIPAFRPGGNAILGREARSAGDLCVCVVPVRLGASGSRCSP